MAEKRTQVNVTGASGSLGGLTGSVSMTVSPKPLAKPPWYERVKNRNLDAIMWLWGNSIVRWVVGSSIWDTLFRRRRQPAAAGQV